MNTSITIGYPCLIVFGSQAVTSDVVPIAAFINLLGQAEVAIGGIGIGIIVVALEVNVDVVHLILTVKSELRSIGSPTGFTISRSQQVEVMCLFKIGRQRDVVAWHNEGENAVGIRRERRGSAIVGVGHRLEDVAIGSNGLEGHRLALVGLMLAVEVGISTDEVKDAAISGIADRVNVIRLEEVSRHFHVIGRHHKTVVVTEVAGSGRRKHSHGSGIEVGHGYLTDTITVSRTNEEGHIVKMLRPVTTLIVGKDTIFQGDVTAIGGDALGGHLIALSRLVQIDALVGCILIVT